MEQFMLFKRLSLLVFSVAAMVMAQEAAPAASETAPATTTPAPQAAAPASEAFKEAPLQASANAEKKDDNTSTISVFVKNPEEIRAYRRDATSIQKLD